MKVNEFSPHDNFNRVMDLWWVVALATVLGGVFGFIYYSIHPPIYEATVTFFVTIDLDHFPFQGVREDLIQYNEDMALGTTEGALRSPEVRDELITQAQTLGIPLTAYDLLQNSTIERKHDIWELRYRSEEPLVAQTVVNTWAKIGYQAMLNWQATGKAPSFVIFQPPIESPTPQEPVFYKRNNLVLAGSLIGFTVGIVLSTIISRSSKKSSSPDAE
jgi:uncharacterized protein involved in exopolysaccharide biosynthesis